jgi:hypothetical protein
MRIFNNYISTFFEKYSAFEYETKIICSHKINLKIIIRYKCIIIIFKNVV